MAFEHGLQTPNVGINQLFGLNVADKKAAALAKNFVWAVILISVLQAITLSCICPPWPRTAGAPAV